VFRSVHKALLLVLSLSATAPALGQEPAEEPDQAITVESPEADEPEAEENEPKEDSINILGTRLSIVAGVGVLWPVSERTREDFGSQHFSPSVAFWAFRSGRGVHFSLDLNWRSFGDEAGNANIWSVYAGAVWLARHRTRDAIPYFSLRAGPYLLDVPDRSVRLGVGGTVDAGVVLWRRFIVSGRWDIQSKQAGYDLSTLGARLAIRLF